MRIKSLVRITGNGYAYAVTSADTPGLCSVGWEAEGQLTGITCPGYVTTDGALLVPAFGKNRSASPMNDDGTLDQKCGGWYNAETGGAAIFVNGQLCVGEYQERPQ